MNILNSSSVRKIMKRKRHTALSKDQSRKRSGDYLTNNNNNNNNLPSDIKT
jgi:hypothetical protein